MKHIYHTYLIIILLLASPTVYAQESPGLQQRADQLFTEYQYARAAAAYQKLSSAKRPKLQNIQRLADCYRLMNRYADARNWYAKVVADSTSTAENLLHYGDVQKALGEYAAAKKTYEDYVVKSGSANGVAVRIAGCDSAIVWQEKPASYELKNEREINTSRSEFAAFPAGNTVYYASEADTTARLQTYGWTGNPFLELYSANRSADFRLSNPVPAEPALNSTGKYHSGPLIANKTGDTYFITRTYTGRETENAKETRKWYRTYNLELVEYRKVNDLWQQEVPGFNNVSQYSVGHAALSTDEKRLYFASDMPGGAGGTDIWFAEKQAGGSWGNPQNAGKAINTAGNELFPFISASGTLYFASDGLPGLGGLDIFSSVNSGGTWAPPINLRNPINSPGDDFAYISSGDGTRGYISSDRQGGLGSDDIYSFYYKKPPLVFAVAGNTHNRNTNELLAGVLVELFKDNGRVDSVVTAADGYFFFALDSQADYRILVSKTGFTTDSASITTMGLTQSDTIKVRLDISPAETQAKNIQLPVIYYDFDKSLIRTDAGKQLRELVITLRQNPDIRIRLTSHTDSRGPDAYNQWLSEKRAKAALDYLLKAGISAERITARGYGESQLTNRCANGVRCTAQQHQLNRRTEISLQD